MSEEKKYYSSYEGDVIDSAVRWVRSHIAVNLTELYNDFTSFVRSVNERFGTLKSEVVNASDMAVEAKATANDVAERTTTLETSVGSLRITRTIATDGLYIGISVNGTEVHAEKIQPITFNGIIVAGKNSKYGIVDRDFVNDLKEWVKKAVNGELDTEAGQTEPFRPKWKDIGDKVSKVETATAQEFAKTTEAIKGLEVYKDMNKTTAV